MQTLRAMLRGSVAGEAGAERGGKEPYAAHPPMVVVRFAMLRGIVTEIENLDKH